MEFTGDQTEMINKTIVEAITGTIMAELTGDWIRDWIRILLEMYPELTGDQAEIDDPNSCPLTDLWCRQYVLKCLDVSNVKTNIQSLNAMYQQLKGMGEEITGEDFMTLILTSLHKSYQPLINMISLQNHATPNAIKPAIIMELILEEFD